MPKKKVTEAVEEVVQEPVVSEPGAASGAPASRQ